MSNNTHNELMRAIGRLESSVALCRQDIRDMENRLIKADDSVIVQASKQERRIASLERSRSALWAAGSLVVAGFSGLLGYLKLNT